MVFGAIAKGIGSVLGGITGGIAEGIQGPKGSASREGMDTAARSADDLRKRFMDALGNGGQNNFSPQMLDVSHVNPYADQALGMSREAAQGRAPSAAAIQQGQGLEQALKFQQAAANSARGGAGNQIAAIKNAQNQGAQLQQQAIGNAAALRANEQAQARSLFGQQAFQQAGMANQRELSNQQAGLHAGLANQQLNQQQQLAMLGGLQNAEALRLQGVQGYNNNQAGIDNAYSQGRSNIGGGLLNAAGAGLGLFFSDEKTKTNIHDGGHEAQKFLDALHAHVYEYKDQYKGPAAPEGKHMTPMAQELEKSSVGKQMVHETADGTKMVDYSSPQGYGAILAALGHLNEKVKGMESRRSKRG